MVVPTWQSECSRSHRRGQLVMIEGALITCGIMVCFLPVPLHSTNEDISNLNRLHTGLTSVFTSLIQTLSPGDFLYVSNSLFHSISLTSLQLAFQIFFCIPILLFVLSLPESPRWLILQGKEAEAIDVLTALSSYEPESQYIVNEFHAIKDTVIEASKGSFRDLFTMDEYRHFHRVVLAYVNQMFQQISGINLVSFISH